MDDHSFADAALHVAKDTGEILGLLFGTMVAVDLLDTYTHGWTRRALAKHPALQYLIAPLIAVFPGCAGMIANVSLYRHGLIGFGALAGGMIAGSGDEGMFMLQQFPPRDSAILFSLLLVCGVVFGVVIDRVAPLLRIRPDAACTATAEHRHHAGFRHYLREHVWGHVIRKHLLKTTAWTVGALVAIEWIGHTDWIGQTAAENPGTLLVTGALIGVIPESGPHMVIAGMYADAKGAIPLSVVFASSFVQDGHGMLPLLATSFRDFAWIKAINIVLALAVGFALLAAGM